MKAMASRGARPPSTTEWRSRERGRAPAVLWLALPGLAALGAGLPVVAATRVGLVALGLLLVVAGGLVTRRVMGVVWDRPRSSHWSLPARQAGAVPVGGHRAGRDARRRAPGVWSRRAGVRRARDQRGRSSLPAGRHAWRDR